MFLENTVSDNIIDDMREELKFLKLRSVLLLNFEVWVKPEEHMDERLLNDWTLFATKARERIPIGEWFFGYIRRGQSLERLNVLLVAEL